LNQQVAKGAQIMQSRSPITRHLSLLMASLITVLVSSGAFAQQTSYKASFTQTKEALAVNVLVGQSRVINFDKPVGRFSVSNPEIAEAVLVTPDQVLVNGKAFGQVNFIAWEQSGKEYLVFDVYVRANLSLIDSQMRVLFPKDDIRLSQANGSVVLSGNVSDPTKAAQAQSVVEAAGFKTVNMLSSPVQNMTQVQLQVRVAEVSRSRMRDLGTSYTSVNNGTSVYASGGGPANLSNSALPGLGTSFVGSALNLFLFNSGIGTAAYIKALQTQGALRELAEPNLIAMNGQEASFLAGGEFPIPVLQGGGNPWRGMIYGMTNRMPWSDNADPRPIWKVWDEFGIQGSEMIGYWSGNCPVKTDNNKVLATVYKKKGAALISVASWADDDTDIKLNIDWNKLGMDSNTATISVPAITNFQQAVSIKNGDTLHVPKGKGYLIIIK